MKHGTWKDINIGVRGDQVSVEVKIDDEAIYWNMDPGAACYAASRMLAMAKLLDPSITIPSFTVNFEDNQ